MSQRLVLLTLCLLVFGACQESPERIRYEAERSRYWAERADIRFALERNPSLRRGYASSGRRHQGVASLAYQQLTSLPAGELRSDLELIVQQARLRAGAALLLAGDVETARTELVEASSGPRRSLREEAHWLLMEQSLEFSDLVDAHRHADALIESLLERRASEEMPGPKLRALPLRLARAAVGHPDPLQEEQYFSWADQRLREMAERWPERAFALETGMDRHRLRLLRGDLEGAKQELRALSQTRGAGAELDRLNFAEALLLSNDGQSVERADSLFAHLADQASSANLRAWSELRRTELALKSDREGAAAAMAALARNPDMPSEVAAEALLIQAFDLERRGEALSAVRAYRTLSLRFPGSAASLHAPTGIIRLQSRHADPRRRQSALQEAATRYREMLNLLPGDSDVGIDARRTLASLHLEMGEPEEALRELEQIFHLRGSHPDGLLALLAAAEIADRRIDNQARADGYLRLIVECAPASPWAEEATRRRNHP